MIFSYRMPRGPLSLLLRLELGQAFLQNVYPALLGLNGLNEDMNRPRLAVAVLYEL